MGCECVVEFTDVPQVLQTGSAHSSGSGAAQVEIEKSGDESAKEPLSQLPEAPLGREAAHSIFQNTRVGVAK